RVSHLGFDHPELREMAARLRLLRPKRRTKTVNFPKRGGGRFVVELSRLRQVSLLAFEVINLKERRRSFTRRRRKNRRIEQRETVVVEKVSHGLHDRVPHFQHCVLPARTQPKMPAVQEKLGAVFLRCDG